MIWGKMVRMHDTMKDIGIGHDCTLRCTGILSGWTKNGCGRSEIVASGVGARRTMIRLHLQLLPTLLVPPVDLPRGQTM